MSTGDALREATKRVLGFFGGRTPASGATVLIYHRVGGGTGDELDLSTERFESQLQALEGHEVISLDAALDRLQTGDRRPSFVLTFDDGFADVYENAWPLLRARGWPFTIYLASAYVDATMRWEGATAKGAPGRGLTWGQLREMVDSGLCTVGNHTHSHVRPAELTVAEVDACSAAISDHLGVAPQHFAYPWGVAVAEFDDDLRGRFRSAVTGELGRNSPGQDLLRVRRVPVRRTDPDRFFTAKLTGGLGPERIYARLVGVAKSVGVRG